MNLQAGAGLSSRRIQKHRHRPLHRVTPEKALIRLANRRHRRTKRDILSQNSELERLIVIKESPIILGTGSKAQELLNRKYQKRNEREMKMIDIWSI
jgi:hypothetical protein